jgi:sugar/nucleoside kinase (ribokinase family)
MHKIYDVYGIGNALVDLEYRVTEDFLREHGINKGMMTLVEQDAQQRLMQALEARYGKPHQASGGSATNSVTALSNFGGRAFYSCKVASDPTGDFYMHDLHASGVFSNLGHERPAGISGTCVVMLTPDAERTMHTFLGITADVSRHELVPEALRAAHWLYIEGYLCTSPSARDAVLEARRIAREAGTKIAMTFSDPAMVQFFKNEIDIMLDDGVDLLFCNEQEAMTWAGADTVEAALEALKARAGTVIITLGKDGALIWDGSSAVRVPVWPVTLVDTLGAGDMFAGASLYGVSQGWTLERAARLGSRAAGAVVSRMGPRLAPEEHKPLLADVQ